VTTPLDRAGHRRADAAWLADAWSRAKVIVVDAPDRVTGHVLVRGPIAKFGAPRGVEQPRGVTSLVFFDAADPAVAALDGPRMFLGVDTDDIPYFAVVAALPEVDGARPATLREVGHLLDEPSAAALATVLGLANWHARHGYSPSTGLPTEMAEGGWTRVETDGAQHWPRTDPAVIMLVHDGVAGGDGRCLLANSTAWQPRPGHVRRYSCLAGFVEPGESAEDAVAREVFEEVGVRVADVRYVGSQPWPYPGSLMLGFQATADPAADLHLDPAEIAAARWFTRTEVLASMAAEARPDGPQCEPGLPTGSSIAYALVRAWVDGAFNRS
jgi:NAD+ diphosphatase